MCKTGGVTDVNVNPASKTSRTELKIVTLTICYSLLNIKPAHSPPKLQIVKCSAKYFTIFLFLGISLLCLWLINVCI